MMGEVNGLTVELDVDGPDVPVRVAGEVDTAPAPMLGLMQRNVGPERD